MNVETEIAETILSQMGGFNRLQAAVGMNSQQALTNGVFFMFKGSSKANKVRITLKGDDTYTVEFFKINHKALARVRSKADLDNQLKGMRTPVASYTDVYCDQLMKTFEEATGLVLSLREMS